MDLSKIQIDPLVYDNDRSKQGYLGELLVKDIFENKGFQVYMNDYKYGPWDMVLLDQNSFNAKFVQVKTIQRYVIKNYWGIRINDSRSTVDNFLKVDSFVIVNRSPSNLTIKDSYAGKIFAFNPSKIEYTITKRDIIIDCDQDHIIHIGNIHPNNLKILDSFRS